MVVDKSSSTVESHELPSLLAFCKIMSAFSYIHCVHWEERMTQACGSAVVL